MVVIYEGLFIMKKEEEKSYVGLFILLSFILVVTNVWALWNEIAGKRPWKDYQTRFYELEYENAKKNYDKAVLAFGQPQARRRLMERWRGELLKRPRYLLRLFYMEKVRRFRVRGFLTFSKNL